MAEKIRVALVDDHCLVLDGLSSLLSLEADIEVTAALPDGQHVFSTLEVAPVDVLVLDVQMP